MKAVIFHKYGSVDSLELIEAEKPVPGDHELLVRVNAVSINSWDMDILKGIPFANRLQFGILKPKPKILGCDLAGRIEKVGAKVRQFQTGDEVFGDISACGMGSFAEYVCVPEKIVALKPEALSFEEAAAMPHTAVLALQGLRNKGQLQKGQKLMINGAGGGSGTFALQLAKFYGAEVTCVDSSGKFDMLRSLGADHLIDYTKEDFAEGGPIYDLILDVLTYRSVRDYKRVLKPGGIYVMLGGGSYSRVFRLFWLGPLLSLFGKKKMGLLLHKPNKEDLRYLTELYEAGKIAPVIDKCYALSELAQAFRYYEENLAQGKVIISIFKG